MSQVQRVPQTAVPTVQLPVTVFLAPAYSLNATCGTLEVVVRATPKVVVPVV